MRRILAYQYGMVKQRVMFRLKIAMITEKYAGACSGWALTLLDSHYACFNIPFNSEILFFI